MRYSPLRFLPLLFLSALTACNPADTAQYADASAAGQAPACDPDNGGLTLPDGFCAVVVADSIGRARHLTVDQQGDVYVALSQPNNGGGIVALRDTTGDGHADIIKYFGEVGGTGIKVHDGFLYFSPDTAILRYPLPSDSLVPGAPYQLVAGGLPVGPAHQAKPFTFGGDDALFVTIGAPSNACQEQDRTPGSPAMDPCPILEEHGGIWRFQADQTGQQFSEGARYATGIRNAMAISWNDETGHLYALQHGRDQLSSLFPDLYTDKQSAELPAEEFFLINQGDNFGWPYCYYDEFQHKKVLGPEYGGNGKEVGRCAQYKDPILAFPGHYAPEDLAFYDAQQFPEQYRNGAFIAFHGSWNRAPLPQEGYMVAFVPFQGDLPADTTWQVFANGFKGQDTLESPNDARWRPVGLAIGPDGSLYIADSEQGRIWRVMYKG